MELVTRYTDWTLLDALWSGGKNNARRLCEAHLWDECCQMIEDMADGELSLTDVNDMLWFDFEYVLECLGCRETEDGSIVPLDDGDFE